EDYYALAEQHTAGFGPDVLTLQAPGNGVSEIAPVKTPASGSGGLLLVPPKVQLTAESDLEFYRRKQNTVTVRHVSGDRMVEIVSSVNKSSRHHLRAFVQKAANLLDNGVHLLILDLYPPSSRDPQGIHGAIWEEIANQPYTLPQQKRLTLVAYETGLTVRAFVVPVAVGETLPDMPLFLEPGAHVTVPLDKTYQAAWSAVPRRWQVVLQGTHS